MFRLAFAAACCVLAVGTAAQAQISDVTGSALTNTNLSPGVDLKGAGIATGPGGASNYASSFSITDKAISFESGNTLSGNFASTTSVSRVDFSLTNTQDGPIAPTLTSEITPAGMGLYLANMKTGCASNPQACSQSTGNHTFFDLNYANPDGATGPLAKASFDFQILQNGEQIYDLNGGLQLNVDGRVFLDNNTEQAAATLNGFVTLDKFGTLNANGLSNGALGFAWDATDIDLQLNSIGSFGTSTLSYIVTVSSSSQAACLDGGDTCLVAYAGFGDPIGRGGGTTDASARSPFGIFGLSNFGGLFGSQGDPIFINGVNFAPQTLQVPQLDADGNVVLTANGVPEPATWMSLILGFGILGAALRRRRVLAYT